MIYQLVNKRTEILAIATSHIAHVCNQYNHGFTLQISMPRINSIIFIKIGLKLIYFCQKKTKLLSQGGSAPNPRGSGGWGFRPQTPETAPPPPHCKFLATHLVIHH